jgi:hypothetical protein
MNESIIAATALDAPRTAAASENGTQTKPHQGAPAADAPFDQRESWCDAYVSSLVTASPEISLPEDVRAAHHFVVEFNACKLDPQLYGRQTRDEAEPIPGAGQSN